MTRTAIETHPSGAFFDFTNPTAEMIHVEDIARALSQTCRFAGHTARFYSVAEHALLVSRLVREGGGSRELQLAALHHDSHEAYVGDLPTPLKDLLRAQGEAYDNMVESIDYAIGQAFGRSILDLRFHANEVKAADQRALFIEAAVLKVSRGVGPQWGHDRPKPPDLPFGAVACHEPRWAEHLFLARHATLAGSSC